MLHNEVHLLAQQSGTLSVTQSSSILDLIGQITHSLLIRDPGRPIDHLESIAGHEQAQSVLSLERRGSRRRREFAFVMLNEM